MRGSESVGATETVFIKEMAGPFEGRELICPEAERKT